MLIGLGSLLVSLSVLATLIVGSLHLGKLRWVTSADLAPGGVLPLLRPASNPASAVVSSLQCGWHLITSFLLHQLHLLQASVLGHQGYSQSLTGLSISTGAPYNPFPFSGPVLTLKKSTRSGLPHDIPAGIFHPPDWNLNSHHLLSLTLPFPFPCLRSHLPRPSWSSLVSPEPTCLSDCAFMLAFLYVGLQLLDMASWSGSKSPLLRTPPWRLSWRSLTSSPHWMYFL